MEKAYQKNTIYSFVVEGIEFQTIGIIQNFLTVFCSIQETASKEAMVVWGYFEKMKNGQWIYQSGSPSGVFFNKVKSYALLQLQRYINENEPPRKEDHE